jgi:hypothetical protein
LRLQIGKEEIPVVHTHSVELSVTEGEFLDHTEVVIAFPWVVRVFGRVLAEAPSLAQRIACAPVQNDPSDLQRILAMRCSLSPLKAGTGKFRIVMATDHREPPTLSMVANNADLIRADAYLSGTHQFFGVSPDVWVPVLSVLLGVVCAGTAFAVRVKIRA